MSVSSSALARDDAGAHPLAQAGQRAGPRDLVLTSRSLAMGPPSHSLALFVTKVVNPPAARGSARGENRRRGLVPPAAPALRGSTLALNVTSRELRAFFQSRFEMHQHEFVFRTRQLSLDLDEFFQLEHSNRSTAHVDDVT